MFVRVCARSSACKPLVACARCIQSRAQHGVCETLLLGVVQHPTARVHTSLDRHSTPPHKLHRARALPGKERARRSKCTTTTTTTTTTTPTLASVPYLRFCARRWRRQCPSLRCGVSRLRTAPAARCRNTHRISTYTTTITQAHADARHMNQSIAPQGFDVTAAHLAALLSPSLSPFIDSLGWKKRPREGMRGKSTFLYRDQEKKISCALL